MMTTIRYTLALGLAALPLTAHAQQLATPSDDAPALAQLPEAPAPSTPPAPPPAPKAPLAAFAAPFRALNDAGLRVNADLYDDLQGNPVGGLDHGVANAGGGTIGADGDLQKLAGIKGGHFHLLFTYEYGDTLQQDIGNFIKTQDWYLPFQKFQLAQLAYQQSLFDGKVDVYGGRVSGAAMFARSTYGCAFIGGSQCPYYLPVFTGGLSGFPYSTWGGRVRVNTSSHTYVQAGGFAVDPVRKTGNGFGLGLETTTGVAVPVEIGYESSFENDRYPRHYRLGGWWNNAPSADPLFNTAGQSRALFGGAALTHTAPRGGIYGVADQVIFRPDDSRRNVAVFGSFAAPLDQHEIFSMQNTLGLYATGPFASRPADTAGFMITQALFTRSEVSFLNDLLRKNGSTSFVKRDQFIFEANYGFQAVPGVTLTPSVQYIVNPDTIQRPDARTAPGNALVFGIRLSLKLSDIVGY